MSKILVVDDEPRNLRLIESLLLPLGYDLTLVASGVEALAKVKEVHPDLILLDIMMPEMDGYEVAKRIKNDAQISFIPIVMVTSLNAVEDRVRALEAGADDFLSKPVDKTELRTRVKSLLKVKEYNDYMRDFQKKLANEVDNQTHLLTQTNEKLKATIKEKETLIQEIHHRVKNNMQIISSLLRLQARKIRDKEIQDIFKTCVDRIRSMALIHESLYQSDNLASIDVSSFVEKLLQYLYHSHRDNSSRLRLHVDIEKIQVDMDKAIPVGLIINELFTNSLRHAFPEKNGGNISVGMHIDKDGIYLLEMSDNGIGIPEETDFLTPSSLGLQIVRNLVQQLEGSIELERNTGTKITVKFS